MNSYGMINMQEYANVEVEYRKVNNLMRALSSESLGNTEATDMVAKSFDNSIRNVIDSMVQLTKKRGYTTSYDTKLNQSVMQLLEQSVMLMTVYKQRADIDERLLQASMKQKKNVEDFGNIVIQQPASLSISHDIATQTIEKVTREIEIDDNVTSNGISSSNTITVVPEEKAPAKVIKFVPEPVDIPDDIEDKQPEIKPKKAPPAPVRKIPYDTTFTRKRKESKQAFLARKRKAIALEKARLEALEKEQSQSNDIIIPVLPANEIIKKTITAGEEYSPDESLLAHLTMKGKQANRRRKERQIKKRNKDRADYNARKASRIAKKRGWD